MARLETDIRETRERLVYLESLREAVGGEATAEIKPPVVAKRERKPRPFGPLRAAIEELLAAGPLTADQIADQIAPAIDSQPWAVLPRVKQTLLNMRRDFAAWNNRNGEWRLQAEDPAAMMIP
jgi:hypothetical protein